MMTAIRAERRKREAEAERERLARDIEKIRARCQTLAGFVHEAWHVLEPKAHLVWGWALDAMADHLEAVTRGEITRLLTNCPPGLMKSLLTSVFWPAWEWGAAGLPHMRYLASSYSQDNVMRDNTKMRRLVESEWYRTLWPEVALSPDQNAKGKFENTKSGGREGRPFASMTGGRGDRVIIDDPHSTETAESAIERANTIRIFRESISDRLNDLDRSAIVIIMQRLHADDVSGTIQRLGLPYEHLCLPMEFEAPRKATSIGFIDPRTQDGELLLPERFSRDAVEKLKVVKGSVAYSGQYQQRPTPREGGLFKRAWFDGKIIQVAPVGTRWWRHWDLAATAKKTSARTAGVKIGKAPDGRIIVGHVITTQSEGHEVRKIIRATAETDGRDVRISLPQDPGQAGKVQKADLVAMLEGFVVRADPETGDKVTRAEPFSSQCEAGNVYLVRAEWNDPYLDEICLFPGGSFKDQVDASSGAFGRLLDPNAHNPETWIKAFADG
ncbi:phage terminase large subunit [Kaistia dalseonensis]|uniref:Phage terminase large subunit-like protein n=1 Tax=Kaistia dalseonensis TaxID=410840 RepID=A0ABU0H6P6_9HYPH|nr:phage terminase large subunit [Kaistia dalseonensis]MCX5495386.1 phage terminase large subunit [Kaistia dalseonensis]MDQ0437974.1 putative phage terminase large subunit-like protein [Kaistia dalseonensis]